MNRNTRRPVTPTYIAFYILFSPDTWRILAGAALALVFTPYILPPDLSTAGAAMLYLMVAAIGWALSHQPARWLTGWLKKVILGRQVRRTEAGRQTPENHERISEGRKAKKNRGR